MPSKVQTRVALLLCFSNVPAACDLLKNGCGFSHVMGLIIPEGCDIIIERQTRCLRARLREKLLRQRDSRNIFSRIG